MAFPQRVYTKTEVEQARTLIENGYRHNLKISGTPEFVSKIQNVLELIKTANHYEFLITYIRNIREIDGLSQLREEEAAIWFNIKALDNSIDDAGFLIQKTQQMKDFIEGRIYYETEEIKAVNKRLEFVETLKNNTADQTLKKRCEENLEQWREQPFP
ncbi:MAG: hypothetical protein WC325_04175 [Candidatus Bathyarchaeia archaeon]|jgi:tRNA nucleotidyltransferase/poly(A) polymerase